MFICRSGIYLRCKNKLLCLLKTQYGVLGKTLSEFLEGNGKEKQYLRICLSTLRDEIFDSRNVAALLFHGSYFWPNFSTLVFAFFFHPQDSECYFSIENFLTDLCTLGL